MHPTQQFRTDQAALAKHVADRLARVMPALNFNAVDATGSVWAAEATRIVADGHAAAVEMGAAYFDEVVTGRFTIVPGTLDAGRVSASLQILGPWRVKQLIGQGVPYPEAARTVFAQTSGAAIRHTLAGARDTVRRSATASSITYVRVTGPNPCGFCAMCAIRKYIVKTGGVPPKDSYHDHCKCTTLPATDAAVPDDWDDVRRGYEAVYQVATGNVRERRRTDQNFARGTEWEQTIREMNRLMRLDEAERFL